MPSDPVAATRLAALTAPLGGTATVRQPGSTASLPSSPATGGAGSFSGLLLDQLSGSTSLDPVAGITGSSGNGGLAASSLAATSPQIARALAVAQSTIPSTAALTTPVTLAGSTRSAQAVAWTKSMLGRQDWNNLCEKFVEEAYGTTGIYPTAAAAGKELVTHRGLASLREAPVGALLYFAADATNDFNGHAAIYLGNGKMISARPDGVREERVDSPYNADRFVGWGEARFPAKPRPGAVPSKSAPSVAPAAALATAPATAPTTLFAPTLASASPVMPADQPKRLPVLTPSPLPKLRSSLPTQKPITGSQASTPATATPPISAPRPATNTDGVAPTGQLRGDNGEQGAGNRVGSPALPAPLPALAPVPLPAPSAADRKPLPPLPVRVSTTA